MTTIDKSHIRRLEAAFHILAGFHRRGIPLEIRRGHPAVPEGTELQDTDRQGLLNLEEPIKDILVGQRKDWAKDRREIILAAEACGAAGPRVAALQLNERRIIGLPLLVGLDDAKAMERLGELLRTSDNVIVATAGWAERGIIGRVLAELEIGRGKLVLTEVDAAKTTDYRYFLAGSAWVDMKVRTEGDPSAQALMCSMQVRSLRQEALREVKQGSYTATAIRAMRREGVKPADIAVRLKLPADFVERCLGERAPDDAAETKTRVVTETRPPSLKQTKFVEDVLRDFDMLGEHVPEGWRLDGELASSFLSQVKPHLTTWRNDIRRIQRAKALRLALGEGRPLVDACAASGVLVNEVLDLLKDSPEHLQTALRISAASAFSGSPPTEESF